jgi:hypothetical protein
MQMQIKVRHLIFAALVAVAGCGGSGTTGGGAGSGGSSGSGGSGGASGGDMAMLVNGCPSFADPQPAQPADTWNTFAQGFFASYCTRCHSSTLTGPIARNGATDGFNWDDEQSVKGHLAMIRQAVGVANFMPPSAPVPTCAERQRLVEWIDNQAP